jgi:hypothetical protein
MVPSFLASFLRAQQQRLDQSFATTWNGPWLVWEASPWRAAPKAMMRTVKFDGGAPVQSKKADVLCFFLGNQATRIVIGREPPCDVVINDLTVSRQHVALSREGERWTASAIDGREVLLAGKPLGATEVLLAPRVPLQLGGVHLSFHDTTSLLQRLAETA